MTPPLCIQEREIRAAFAALDSAGDGDLSFEDMRRAAETMWRGGRISHEQMFRYPDRMWEIFDGEEVGAALLAALYSII